MATLTHICTVCSREFEPRFRYQMEERVERDSSGRPRVGFAYYCSQQCLDRSLRGGADGSVACHACGAQFRPELAAHVLFGGGRRRYACSKECREQLLADQRRARLGRAQETRTASISPASTPPVETGFPHVLAVFNHKGGTGKTTTAVTLAASLAERGRRVLLVDTDGQGNVAVSLGLGSERSLYHVLVMGLSCRQVVQRPRPGLDVLPSNETVAAAELYLAGRRHRHQVLANRLSEAAQEYDHVIVDCSPSLSLMNQNALVFANAVLCPVACDYLSLVGVRQVMRTIRQVNRLLAHRLDLWGVLPTMFDSRARICHEAVATLQEHFGPSCLEPIRVSTRVKEAPAQGQTISEYSPGSTATEDYLRVVDRILNNRRRDESAASPCTTAAGGVG